MAEDLSINKNKIFTQRYGNSNNDICRLCLKNEAHMEPLFYSNLFPNILLTKKIYDCTSIQIIYERNLPMFICKLCANKLDEYVRFRERCIANDEFLRNALAAFGANGATCAGTIKTEPEDTPPPLPAPAPPPKFVTQCLGVTPMELNCALVAAAAAAAAGHQTGKREPPDVEDDDDDDGGYGHRSDGASPTMNDLQLKRTLDDRYRNGNDDDDDGMPNDDDDDDVYGGQESEPPYVCEVCSKPFKIRHHLMVHRHTHVDNHPMAVPMNGMLQHGGGGGGPDFVAGPGTGKPSYSCPKCAKAFVNKGNLLNHLETHANEKSYACDICAKTFKYNVQLRLHMRIHTGERPHKCEICNRGFSQLSNLRSHRKTHSKVKPYKCHLCLKSFTVLDNLTAHSTKCLKDKFRCTLCSKSFAKEGNLLSHLQSHSDGVVEKMFKCEMCPKSFKNKEDWKRHVRVHTGEKPYTCDICAKGFAQKANLLSHRKTHLKPNVVYKCERCARTFRSQKVLEMHLPKCAVGDHGVTGSGLNVGVPSASVTPAPESMPGSPSPANGVIGHATVASSTVVSASGTPTLSEALSDLLRYEIALRAPLELQQMLLGHHIERKKPHHGGVAGGKAAGRRYRCDVCFKGYSQYPSLIKHRKLHFKVPPLVKVLAGRNGRHVDTGTPTDGCIDDQDVEEEQEDDGRDRDEDAQMHVVECPGGVPRDPAERPYGCDICGKTFKYNRNLKVHAKLHVSANRYKCDKCTNTFAQAEDLRTHLATHPIAAGRSFSCEYCSNRFRSNEDLRRHRRSHTGERPFRCPRCPKAFTQQSNLRVHTRIHERPVVQPWCSTDDQPR